MTLTVLRIVWTVLALTGAWAAFQVMLKAEHDKGPKSDAIWIKILRRSGFVVAPATLAYSVATINHWEPSYQYVFVLAGGVFILVNNYIALVHRAPSKNSAETVRWRTF